MFCQDGGRVVTVDCYNPAGTALVGELATADYAASFICADVSNPDKAESAVSGALASFGRIDVSFNHAGVIIVNPFLGISIAERDELIDNNAKNAFLMTRAVLPGMLERWHGLLVFTSTTGVRASTHLESAYSASKSAMHSRSRSLAMEYRDQGIRSNALCSSVLRTNHGAHQIRQVRDYGIFASENDVNLMHGRICEPEEIAKVALCLASDEASFINAPDCRTGRRRRTAPPRLPASIPRPRAAICQARWLGEAMMPNGSRRLACHSLRSTRGTDASMFAEPKSACERKAPIMLWIHEPHWAPAGLEGEYVECPTYGAPCYIDPAWGINPDARYDCGKPEGCIKKMARAGGAAKWPCAYDIVRNCTMSGPEVGALVYKVDVDGVSVEDVAMDWAKQHEETWRGWRSGQSCPRPLWMYHPG